MTRGIVARFRLSVTQPRRDITILGRHPCLSTAHACQLVGPGICAVLGCLGPVFSRHPAVVYRLCAVVRSPSASRGGLVKLVSRVLTVGRRAVTCGSVKVARGVITRFGLSVTQFGCDVAVLRSQAGLPTTHSSQLIGA